MKAFYAVLMWSALAVAAGAQMPMGAKPDGGALPAAAAANPVVWSVNQMYSRSEKNILAAADEMPEAKYGFKPTDGQISFGQIVSHLASSNGALCAGFSDQTAPAATKVPATATKAELTAALKASFDFCDAQMAAITDAKLAEAVPFRGGKVVRARVFLELPADLYDHYSQMAMYLRLNGMLPPSAAKPGAAPMQH